MKYSTLQNSTSLDSRECLSILSLCGKPFAQALHYHDEYELILVEGAEDIQLVAGDAVTAVAGTVLVLVGPGLPHSLNAPSSGGALSGIALRWPSDLLAESFLGKNQLSRIDHLLQEAKHGVLFPPTIAGDMGVRLSLLRGKKGFELYLGLLSILHELSIAEGIRTLSTECHEYKPAPSGGVIDSAFAYMKANYSKPISLADVARTAHMSRGAFCRYIRKTTGKTYMESLNEIRFGHICHMLVGTSENISEIAYKAGYTNIAHFHRSFKRLKGCTPKEYRENPRNGKN